MDGSKRSWTAIPSGSDHLVGAIVTYADLSLFQVVEGLTYAFPTGNGGRAPKDAAGGGAPRGGRGTSADRAYLESDRRIPFNEEGIFRHYPELDG